MQVNYYPTGITVVECVPILRVTSTDPALRGDGCGSNGRASESRPKGRRFESRQDHKKKMCEFFRVKNVVLTRCRCAQHPVCIRRHKNNHTRMLKILSAMSEFGGLRKHEKNQHAFC